MTVAERVLDQIATLTASGRKPTKVRIGRADDLAAYREANGNTSGVYGVSALRLSARSPGAALLVRMMA